VAEKRSGSEDALLKRLRLAAGIVTLSMVVLLVVADVVGRLFIDPSFKVSEILFGTLVGALLAFVGVETLVRLPKKPENQ
jgi:uncharacterized membrane protein YgaE (UPF0421/DUF939 family)